MPMLKKYNILVVDDVILMCDFLYSIAARVADCRVFKALDGKTAADILQNEAIDLLITDIEMRAPTGLELLYRVRSGQFAATSHSIPVLIFLGNAYLDLIRQCISFDINDFLVKPITSSQLKQKIEQHLHANKVIRTPDYYQAIGGKLFASTSAGASVDERKFSVAIVLDSDKPEVEAELAAQDGSHGDRSKDFLFWPENATTGYFQLDRRLKNLAFNVSCFHNVFINNCKTVAIESERKRACDAIDYLLHITKNTTQKEQRPEFWQILNLRMEKLKPLAAELAKINIKHHQGVQVLLKKLSYWWMQTCNRPIIERNEEYEEEPRQHG